jgi:hypothetical protein
MFEKLDDLIPYIHCYKFELCLKFDSFNLFMCETCSTHGGDENGYKMLLGKLEEKRRFGNRDVDVWILLKWILK